MEVREAETFTDPMVSDVLALVCVPPAYIATSGLDGKILLWSLNSGEFVAKLYHGSGSIETMVYAQKLETIFASGEAGQLVAIDRALAAPAVVPLEHPHDEGVVAVRCDRANTHLATGDAAGCVKLWDLTVAADHEGVVLAHVCTWRVAAARVVSLDFIENGRLAELFLLVSSGNGDVSVWTLDGLQVGSFGRHRSWALGRPSTYVSTASEMLPLPEEAAARHTIKCATIAWLNNSGSGSGETFLLEDSMPKPGEVWVCVSGHRTRAITMASKKQQQQQQQQQQQEGGGPTTTTTPLEARESLANVRFLQQKLAENAAELTDLITVVKVTRGEIVCWDGIAGSKGSKQPTQKTIDMSDFVRKAGWTKQPLLTQFIGCMFPTDDACFRVNSIAVNVADLVRCCRLVLSCLVVSIF